MYVTLHCVAFEALEAQDSFTLKFNFQQTQREVYILLRNSIIFKKFIMYWTTPSEVLAMLCVGVCSITVSCPVDTKHIKQKHL